MKKNRKIYIFVISILVVLICVNINIKRPIDVFEHKIDYSKIEFKKILEGIFDKRSSLFITRNLSSLKEYRKYYDMTQEHGQWSFSHEVKRIKYLNDWSYQRGIKFTNIRSNINIRQIVPNENGVKIILDEDYKFDYIYKNDTNPITNSFGISLRHITTLKKNKDDWIIYKDWYLDCFEDGLKAYSNNINDIKNDNIDEKDVFQLGNCPYTNTIKDSIIYNREKAIKYANKYCGVSWASGNDLTHNTKYTNYTGAGGDCTNFVSQVLGDKDAGNLKSDDTWYCHYSQYGNSIGNTAWVNADNFKNYILYNGKGKLIKKGNFKELVIPSQNYPCGIIQTLEIGDIIGYAINDDVDHFAVITGKDSHGYPLVNSHTVNRYHVPWDLGWGDSDISFYLIHIKD